MTDNKAIIIGASMAGLFAARVLADHFESVTVIERDELPGAPDVRGGVPQGRHIHALLVQGQKIIEQLFPGIGDELTETGSPRMTWCRDTCYFTPGGWIKRFDSGIVTNVITRPDLEWRIRRRLEANAKITFVTGRDVKSLISSDDKSVVTGVEVEVRGSHQTERLSADLIVDASGRNSKAPEWLTALGYEAPEETAVNAFIGYSTRIYEKPHDNFDWRVLFISARANEATKRGAGVFDIGHGKWMVSLGGLNEDYPPTDEEGFLEYAKHLPSPTIYEVLKNAKPLTPISGYRIKGSRWRHYERLTRRPERFILMGDSVCAFNPIYGQGITVAAMEALELDGLLKSRGTASLGGLAAAFQKQIGKSITNAWLLATGEDLRFDGTEGDRPNALARMTQKYVDQYLKVSYQDETLTLAFIKVLNLTASPTTLFAPSLMARVIRLSLAARRNGKTSDQSGELIPAIT
jgi:flavin-dependent dehydrogenase